MLPTHFAVAAVAATFIFLVQPSLAEEDTSPPEESPQRHQQPEATLDNAPSQVSLEAAIAAELPAYWAIGELRIVATVNEGDAVEPLVRQRFEADATPAAALFIADADAPAVFEPFIALIPTEPESRTRTLYGIATSTYTGGTWRTEIALENSVDNLGKPRAFFDRPAFILGSDEEAELAERLKANRLQGLQAELERARQVVLEEHAERLRGLEAAHDESVAELRAAQEQDLAELRAQHQDTMQAVRQQQAQLQFRVKAGLPALREKLEREEQEMEAQHRETLEALKADTQRKMQELSADLSAAKDDHAEKLAALRAAHQEAMEALAEEQAEARARREQEIKAQEERHARRLRGLTAELAEAERALRLQHQQGVAQLQTEKQAKLQELSETLAATEENHAQALAAAKAAHQEAMQALAEEQAEARARREQEIEEREAQHASRLEELQRDHSRLEEEQRSASARLQQEHAETLDAMATEMQEMEAAQKRELERLRQAHGQEITALMDELGATEERIALRKQLELKREELAAREADALTAETQRASALMAKFREQAQSTDPGVRREIFLASMESEHASLRKEAIVTALDDEDSSVRQAAIRKALASNEWALQEKALIAAIRRAGTLMLLSSEGDEQGVNHVRMEVGDRGALSGLRVAPDGTEYTIEIGRVSRPGMSWSERRRGNQQCSVQLQLADDASLRGSMECRRGTYPISANLF